MTDLPTNGNGFRLVRWALGSSGALALVGTLLTAYIDLAQEVQARPTMPEVRQVVTDLTADRNAEILRRLDRIEQKLDAFEVRAFSAPSEGHLRPGTN